MAFFGFLSNLLEYGCSVLLPDMNRRRQTSLCVTSVAGNVCIYYYIPLLGPSWLADQFPFGKQRRLMQKLSEIWELRKQSLLKLDYMTVINPKKIWYVWTNFLFGGGKMLSRWWCIYIFHGMCLLEFEDKYFPLKIWHQPGATYYSTVS